MDLEEYIKVMKRPIDQKTAIGWLSQLTQILQEIHNRGIFHRDIKPSNIILQPDGQLVAIDFGAAKQAAVSVGGGQATRIYTPGYAAPEQERGEAFAQSDFFALGRTFVYLLTAKEPTDLYDVNRTQLIWRDKASHVSTDLLNLIDRLMQENPLQRPDTTATIFREIAALSPVVTRQSTGYTPPQPLKTPNPMPQPLEATTPLVAPPQRRLPQISTKWLPVAIVLAGCSGMAVGFEANQFQGLPPIVVQGILLLKSKIFPKVYLSLGGVRLGRLLASYSLRSMQRLEAYILNLRSFIPMPILQILDLLKMVNAIQNLAQMRVFVGYSKAI